MDQRNHNVNEVVITKLIQETHEGKLSWNKATLRGDGTIAGYLASWGDWVITIRYFVSGNPHTDYYRADLYVSKFNAMDVRWKFPPHSLIVHLYVAVHDTYKEPANKEPPDWANAFFDSYLTGSEP